ncbi:unnamed protein product, partial [Effrenium voratum]
MNLTAMPIVTGTWGSAKSMDPNQRKTLEIAFETISMAGIQMSDLKRMPKHIGCFVGVSGSEWGMVPHPTDAAGCGSAEAVISNRVNFALNLKGASQTINTACSAGLVVRKLPEKGLRVRRKPLDPVDLADMDEEENPNDGPGLIKLDMKQFGSGTMEDPLRHAVAMRTAQDQYKMQMWNSFPPLFQNTIFHGEQDLSIAALRKASLAERLARAKELKEEGNSLLKSRSSNAEKPVEESPELSQEIERVEAAIWEKERELKELRQQLASLKAQVKPKQVPQEISEDSERQALEEAVRRYEKAAGLLRYVECIRPDWKNDDGSYK